MPRHHSGIELTGHGPPFVIGPQEASQRTPERGAHQWTSAELFGRVPAGFDGVWSCLDDRQWSFYAAFLCGRLIARVDLSPAEPEETRAEWVAHLEAALERARGVERRSNLLVVR